MARRRAGRKGARDAALTNAARSVDHGRVSIETLSKLLFARILLVASLLAGCARAGEAPSGRPVPTSLAQAEEAKRGGAQWTNGDIRAAYLQMVAAIGPANEAWKRESVPAEQRARRAFQMRHDARLLARAMMKDAAEVEALRERDEEKYGSPDGPMLDWLVARERKKGLTGDAVWEAIVASAQQTNKHVNEAFGLGR